MTQRRITDDLHLLLGVLPPHIATAVTAANNSDSLLEIVLDLGRIPMARFLDAEVPLSDHEVTHAELDHIVSQTGDFDADNRAGLERTLHRISAIRNRKGHIVGLTCRVGRAVYGTIDIIQDLVESGKSILILGKPGIGKTTMLREAARILAESKRVIIVDTSNEIGGDGDVPHPAVGKARRMQVAKPSLQHEVMIEAVENHNPEVIVIDEIGRELEAAAARTIAERGVQLIGTAHGRTLENLLLNPTLSDLIGGIESVTLSDEEARRRGTQKTVLERRSPPTFDVLIEIQERDYLIIHPDVAAAVDALVRSVQFKPEIRYRDPKGDIHIEKPAAPVAGRAIPGTSRRAGGEAGVGHMGTGPVRQYSNNEDYEREGEDRPVPAARLEGDVRTIRILPYGVARNRLMQAAKRLGVPVEVVRNLDEADTLFTLRSYYRSRQQTIQAAETRGLPIYVLRANTVNQMEMQLAEIYNLAPDGSDPGWDLVSNQTQDAINSVLNGQRWADLPPASPAIRRLQHEMARQAELTSHSYGKDPNRRVRIYRD
jgi:stage III sporulation protein SpoIIIAA